MRKVYGIARYTFVEILRNKVWYVLILFSGILIFSTLLLGTLGGEQQVRMITDLGLASIETIALLSTVFAAVSLVLEEMESRTLYLILTRPVARPVFVTGRFLGLVATITCAYLIMATELAALLALVHAAPSRTYALSLLFSWEKIVVITAVAFVFSLFSTSVASAATFTFFFWVMGHMSMEILYLAKRSSQPLVIALCTVFYYLIPNFQIMNVRDIPPDLYRASWLWSAGGYALCYTGVCLMATAALFRKKEF